MEDQYPYRVYDSAGNQVLSAPESCRYSPKIEKSLLESGYAIRLRGKRIWKKDVEKSCPEHTPQLRMAGL